MNAWLQYSTTRVVYFSEGKKVAYQITNMTDFSTTTDLWWSRMCESYLCLTVHHIGEWDFKSLCLQMSISSDQH